MGLSIGIVGLPNVGKSTFFQTITKKPIDRANYPFCTIDPNIGVVAVPDERVDQLTELCHSLKKIYTTIEFVDIAGLVKGANKGEGLGNKFLANIRETDAIIYVLRSFLNENIINTQSKVDPLDEKEILDTELILKDLEMVEKRVEHLNKEIRTGHKESLKEFEVLKKTRDFLEKGLVLIEQDFTKEELFLLKSYQFLTLKPRLYLLNGNEEEINFQIKEIFQNHHWQFLTIDLLNEFEAADLNKQERVDLGLASDSGFDKLIMESYKLLGLITFLTTGVDETRAWTLRQGEKAPQAGGVIHSDFEKHFIRAEVINWRDLINAGGFSKAREKGLVRTEGKEYLVKDGDVIEIKHDA